MNKNIEMLEIVCDGFADLVDKFVFVGGSVTSLYITDPASSYIRPTLDIDCIIEINSRIQFTDLEQKLRDYGFVNSIEVGSPICRWKYKNVLVDIMPTDSKILGFSNIWYSEGIKNSITHILPNGNEIKILSLPYFIATKIEAYYGRDEKDFRFSHDIEDIFVILDGLLDFNEFYNAPKELESYLKKFFCKFVNNKCSQEALMIHIEEKGRVKRVWDFIKNY